MIVYITVYIRKIYKNNFFYTNIYIMNLYMLMYIAALFFILTPGQFLTLPQPSSGSFVINVTHAIIFATVYYFTYKSAWDMSKDYQKKKPLPLLGSQ